MGDGSVFVVCFSCGRCEPCSPHEIPADFEFVEGEWYCCEHVADARIDRFIFFLRVRWRLGDSYGTRYELR